MSKQGKNPVITGSQKIRSMLLERLGLSVSAWARNHGYNEQDGLSMAAGVRRTGRRINELRELLAADLNMPRSAIDELIDGPPQKGAA
jgi:hypothetical protein